MASTLLPARLRRHLLAVYGYARLVDEVGDAAGGDRLALLDEIEADLDRLYAGESPRIPLVAALAPTVTGCALPREPLDRLLEANRRDQHVRRYETFDELADYCAHSAHPVGRLVLAVFGQASPERIALSDAICAALQVLEHCQDVAEDRAAGRVYLPAADLRAHRVAEADLAAPTAGPGLRAVVALQVQRAAALLERGRPLVARLTGLARVAVAGYVAGGLATARALAAADYDVLGTRVRPNRGRVAVEWVRLAVTGGRR